MSSAPHEFAISYPVPFLLQILSALRSLWVTFITDNPLTWSWMQGRRNPRADMEGPLYVLNSPYRQLERGRTVMATIEEMTKSGPFLVTISVRDHKGDPLPNAQLDWWQADAQGTYYYRSYGLRGKILTDANGIAEVLTIAPGHYGSRAAHIHIMLSTRDSVHGNLTTQLYVCESNDPVHIKGEDLLNHVRTPREANILSGWSIPSEQGGAYLDLPTLDKSDVGAAKRIEWWNQKLEDQAPGKGLRVVGGGSTSYTLNVKPGVFGF
ncbi:Intradiol ring-cleavage dioxygenase [Irpex rosettiformis]|uniref:Intradiol ring-cleavage dioxygenase n=1 Tax=Irpex rosettiformis TaxID=378272 RepID=A0ACB8U0L9_9APHY|nr:Intradiol ring-cleavage dioxygenase [Irpex rosettiformis]